MGRYRHVDEYDFMLEVSAGNVPFYRNVNKFGAIQEVGTSYEDIWATGGTWLPLATEQILEIASTSTLDDVGGTGARSIIIQGLDGNYNEIEDTVILTGQVVTTTNIPFRFINRAFITSAGSLEWNAGNIAIVDPAGTFVAGVPQDLTLVQVTIEALEGQTQVARYTVPAGHSAYMTNLYVLSGAAKTVTFSGYRRDHEVGTRRVFFEGTMTDVSFEKGYSPPAKFPEKVTIVIRARVIQTTGLIAAGFDLVLIEDE